MKFHWSMIVILVVGYVIGVKFPQLGSKVGLSA